MKRDFPGLIQTIVYFFFAIIQFVFNSRLFPTYTNRKSNLEHILKFMLEINESNSFVVINNSIEDFSRSLGYKQRIMTLKCEKRRRPSSLPRNNPSSNRYKENAILPLDLPTNDCCSLFENSRNECTYVCLSKSFCKRQTLT